MRIDHYKTFSAEKQSAENRTWFADTIHPNGLGHAHMAAEMFRVRHPRSGEQHLQTERVNGLG